MGAYSFDIINGYHILGDVDGNGSINAVDGQELQKIYLEAVVVGSYDNIDQLIADIREQGDYPTIDDGWFYRGDIDFIGDVGRVLQAQWVLQYFLQGGVLDNPLPFAHFLNIYGTDGPDEEDTPPE